MRVKRAKNYTAEDTAKIHDMFNNGVPLHEISNTVGTTECGAINKINKEHAFHPDDWDLTMLKKYRRTYHQHNREKINKNTLKSVLGSRMRKYIRPVGYEMDSISKKDGYVRVQIDDDTLLLDSINMRELKEDFREHVKKALAYGQYDPKRSDRNTGDRRRFKGLPEDIKIGLEDAGDDYVVNIGFDRRGINDAMKGKIENFLDVYCYLLKSEKRIQNLLRRQIEKSVSAVGYQMASISRKAGYVRVEIEDDTLSLDSIDIRQLKEDFREHANEALAYGLYNPRSADSRRLEGLIKPVIIGQEGVEDDIMIIIDFDRRGIDEATRKEMDNFLDVYCHLLKSEKRIQNRLRRQSVSLYIGGKKRISKDKPWIVSKWRDIFSKAVGSGDSKYSVYSSIATIYGVDFTTAKYHLDPKYRASKMRNLRERYRRSVRERKA